MCVDGVVEFLARQLGAALNDRLDAYPQVDNANCVRFVDGYRLNLVGL